jgi:hypothetical protein
MSMAVTTSRVSCPRCGESATLTVQTAFGSGADSSKAPTLLCGNGCQPDEAELAGLLQDVAVKN